MAEATQGGILVIGAHPDDELLGCGGTVALHAARGEHVTSVIICEGESLRYGEGSVGQREHAAAAAHLLGVKDLRLLGFPDQRLDTFPMLKIVQAIEQVVEEVQPRIVYCQYGGDINYDHKVVFEAVLVATRPVLPHIRAVYAFDTASSTEWGYPRSFVPDTWVDIGATLERKLAAMACYASEVRPWPHPRSLEALRAKAAATGCQALMTAAEAFMTIRRVCRDGEAPV
jgi:LmbE family N-acetylglucosaminyl deacetylase